MGWVDTSALPEGSHHVTKGPAGKAVKAVGGMEAQAAFPALRAVGVGGAEGPSAATRGCDLPHRITRWRVEQGQQLGVEIALVAHGRLFTRDLSPTVSRWSTQVSNRPVVPVRSASSAVSSSQATASISLQVQR